MIRLPANSALLVVDLQQGFDDPIWGPRNNHDAETNVARLIAAWRTAQWPVFHVFHDSLSPESPLRRGASGNAPKPEAEPEEGETIIRKTVNSAFIGTSLEADLRNARVDTLVVVGLTTNHCISTSVRMAGNLNFATYVVSDATATFNRTGLDGRDRPAEEVHAAALSDLQGEFATVIDTPSLLEALARVPPRPCVGQSVD